MPNEGPQIEILKQSGSDQQRGRFFLDEQVELRCSTSESKPAAALDWIINDSLNLSAPIESQLQQLFTIKNQRFVRIPSVNRSGSSNYQAIGRTSAKTVPRQTVVSYDTYELHGANATLFNPVNEREATLVNLASSSLDQLLETSISRLNFTVDVDLLQSLSYSNRHSYEEGSTYRARNGQSNRKSLSLKRVPITGGLLVLPNSTSSDKMIPNQLSTNAISRSKRSKPTAGSPSMSLSNSLSSFSPQALVDTTKFRSSGNSFITGARRPNQEGVSLMNDSNVKQVQLKIKCVARLLQITMSHQTKIQLVSRTKDSERDSSSLVNALRRQHTGDKNSAATFRPSNYRATFIFLAYFFIKIWTALY